MVALAEDVPVKVRCRSCDNDFTIEIPTEDYIMFRKRANEANECGIIEVTSYLVEYFGALMFQGICEVCNIIKKETERYIDNEPKFN